MKKKVVAILVAGAMVVGLLAACGGGTTTTTAAASAETQAAAETEAAAAETQAAAPSGEVVKLKLGHNNPAKGQTGLAYEKFAEYVSELSGGTMEIELYPGGTLVDDTNSFDSLIDGSIDFIHDAVSRETSKIPDLSPLEIPGHYTGSAEDWYDWAESIRDELDAIYKDAGIKYIAGNYQGASCFVGNTQIVSPSDMSGKSIRAIGTWLSKAVQAWGGAPVALGLGELSTALERGTVDAALTGWVIAIPNAFYEVSSYMTYTKLDEAYACLLMNLDNFNALTEEQQNIIIEAGQMMEKYTVELTTENYQPGVDAATAAGCTVVELTDEQNDEFVKPMKALFEECKSSLSDKGLALLDAIGVNLD